MRDEFEIETLFVGVAGHAAKSFGKGFGITVGAAGTDFDAAAHGVPGGIGPFDFGMFAHDFILANHERNGYMVNENDVLVVSLQLSVVSKK